MHNLPLTQQELELFEQFLDMLRDLTIRRLSDKGYRTNLPEFNVVYKCVAEEVNAIIKNSENSEEIRAMFSFAVYCSRKLTNEESMELNVRSMAVDVYRCLGGKI